MALAWDKSWEKVYQTQGYRAKYPNEELVRFISRLYKPVGGEGRKKVKILEVGCGPGANIWFLAREGFPVYGIDGSDTAIQMCQKRLEHEGLSAEVIVGDIIKLPYPQAFFDVVIDIAAIQHNTPENISRILSEIARVLKTGGSFFSMARSSRDYLFGQGQKIAENTYTDIPMGNMEDVGITHFFTIPEIRKFWGGQFVEVGIEYTERTVESMSYPIAHYLITAKK